MRKAKMSTLGTVERSHDSNTWQLSFVEKALKAGGSPLFHIIILQFLRGREGREKIIQVDNSCFYSAPWRFVENLISLLSC